MIELTVSQMEYLKAIYTISLTNKITVTNIAQYLDYSKPSVVRALKNLHDLDLIIYTSRKIELTAKGAKYAKNIIRKDNILQRFLIQVLHIDPELAKKDAYNLKYGVSCYTITKLEEYISGIIGDEDSNIDDYCLCNQNNNYCSHCNKEIF